LAASNAKALYAPPYAGHPGYLLCLRDQTLMVQPFDAKIYRPEDRWFVGADSGAIAF